MIAAEQKARTTYDNILRLSDDPDVNNVIRFLREREVVHFQRFGETKRTRWNREARAADKLFQIIQRSAPAMQTGALPLSTVPLR